MVGASREHARTGGRLWKPTLLFVKGLGSDSKLSLQLPGSVSTSTVPTASTQ